MQLYNTEIHSVRDGWVRISTQVQTASPGQLPETLWCEFPAIYRQYIADSGEGFVAMLLMLAMHLQEPLFIDRPLSARFLYGVGEYQKILAHLFPSTYHLIDVQCSGIQTSSGGDKTGCPFSGGADSFYTYLRHRADYEKGPLPPVSHGLFVHGFDIPLTEDYTFATAGERYVRHWADRGLDLILARTNLRHFVTKLDWLWCHGSALMGVALLFGELYRYFYLPSDKIYTDGYISGSDFRFDHYLSTESLEFLHDGAETPRTEKLHFISQYPETWDLLRVCWRVPNGLLNCCRCQKCIRTMLMLQMHGSLQQYKTFPHPLQRRYIRKSPSSSPFSRLSMKMIVKMAWQHKRLDIIYDLCLGKAKTIIFAPWRKGKSLISKYGRKINNKLIKFQIRYRTV